MVTVEAIQKAIAAHTGWKARLNTAVSTGKFDLDPSTVRVDNRCDFGKWLQGSELQTADKENKHYLAVKKLHAEFHHEAAKVVDWATSGQKSKAEESLAIGGAYTKASHLLTEAMVKWRQSLSIQ